VVDVTHANGSAPQETVERSQSSPRSPVAWWLVANRVPFFGRP
jgi:hypothetical protein